MNIGYIGLDHHHRGPYLASLAQCDVAVTAACEPTGEPKPEAVPDLSSSAAFYTDPEKLLADADVDLVWLTLSNADTPAVIETALEREIDVVTEKPVARTAADLDPIVAAESESAASVCVSYPWRAHPVAEKLAALVDEGFFGDVYGFDARFIASQLSARDTDHFLFDTAASRGGIVQWLGVHWLDLVPHLLEDPIERVSARTQSTDPSVGIEDGATVNLETASGAVGTLTCGYYLREGRYDTTVDIFGSDGRSAWDPIGETFGFDGETTLKLDDASGEWRGTPNRTLSYEYEGAPGYGGGWGLQFIEDALTAAEEGTKPPVSLSEARTVLEVLDAVYESAETGEWVAVT